MEPSVIEKLDLTEEQKSGAEPLTEEQEEVIANSGESWEPEEKKEEKGAEEKSVKTDEEVKADEAKLSEQKKKEEQEEKSSEEDTPEQIAAQEKYVKELQEEAEKEGISVEDLESRKEKEEEELKESEKAETERIEAKATELDKTVDEVKEMEKVESSDAETKLIASIAKEEEITVEEAKEAYEKDKTLVERHGSDPIKVARALRKEQSEYGKIKQENDDLKSQAVETERLISEQEFDSKCEVSKEKITEQFREKFPDQSSSLDDDECFSKGKILLRAAYDKTKTEQDEAIKTSAGEARTKLLDGLSDSVKEEFKGDLEETLKECTDEQVVSPKFEMENMVCYVRGKKYTSEYVKELENAAFKRGQENIKIIGSRQKPSKASPKASDKGKGVSTALDDDQKLRAEEMYSGTNMTKQQMYDEFEKNKDNDF